MPIKVLLDEFSYRIRNLSSSGFDIYFWVTKLGGICNPNWFAESHCYEYVGKSQNYIANFSDYFLLFFLGRFSSGVFLP